MGGTLVDDRYELRSLAGSGGMADVYLAYDHVLDRDVALKLLKERYAGNEDFVERFRREARSAAALSSPFIVPVFDRGETEDGACYIAMEYLPGGTLEDRIARAGSQGSLGNKPLAVVTAGESEPSWLKRQDELATLSSDSTHRVVKGASHASLLYERGDSQATSAAVDELVAAVRNDRQLAR